MKYKVGDKVKQSAVWEANILSPAAFVGEVTQLHPKGSTFAYTVSLDVSGRQRLFMEEEVEAV